MNQENDTSTIQSHTDLGFGESHNQLFRSFLSDTLFINIRSLHETDTEDY